MDVGGELQKQMVTMQKQMMQMQKLLQDQFKVQQTEIQKLRKDLDEKVISQHTTPSVQQSHGQQTSQQQLSFENSQPVLPVLTPPPPSQQMPPTSSQQPRETLPPLTYGSNVTSCSGCSTPSINYVNMPQKKIYPLPSFSGYPEEWQTFSESFYSTTAEFSYSDLHNIMRLRESLNGRAREVVECLLGNSSNVSHIMSTLRETFGRPEQLIRSQIEKVRQITPLQNDNLDSLVTFSTKITNMSTFLKNVKGEHHLANPSLLSELVAKLPINRQMQWGEKCLSLERMPTVVDFSDWLQNLRRIANVVYDTLPSNSRRSNSSHQSRKFAFAAVKNCLVCKGLCPSLINCKQFLDMSVENKWKIIKDSKSCFCCLKKGHQISQCRNRVKCDKSECGKFHHVLLHKTTTSQGIVPVKLYGKHKTITTYAFIDDGANVSMLDKALGDELGLQGKSEMLSLQWLNDHSMMQTTQKVVLTISGVGQFCKRYTIGDVYISDNLSLPVQSCKWESLFLLMYHAICQPLGRLSPPQDSESSFMDQCQKKML
ncbi:uncharacterized protein LOC142225886 isoform X4 [Haematobia irritans]